MKTQTSVSAGLNPQYKRSKVGFPIRKSLDQSSFAAPQGLSQRTTSFIASQRQGIHRMPLRHLITLMIGVRPAHGWAGLSKNQKDHSPNPLGSGVLPNRPDERRGQAPSCSPDLQGEMSAVGSVPSSRCRRSPSTRSAAANSLTLDMPAANGRDGGGARRDRTDDLMLAKHALSQLSYSPFIG